MYANSQMMNVQITLMRCSLKNGPSMWCYPQTLDDLSHGKIGTYKLLNVERPLLNQDMPAKRNHKIFDWAEEIISLTPKEHILVENFRHMTVEQKAAYKTIGDALAQPKADKLAS